MEVDANHGIVRRNPDFSCFLDRAQTIGQDATRRALIVLRTGRLCDRSLLSNGSLAGIIPRVSTRI